MISEFNNWRTGASLAGLKIHYNRGDPRYYYFYVPVSQGKFRWRTFCTIYWTYLLHGGWYIPVCRVRVATAIFRDDEEPVPPQESHKDDDVPLENENSGITIDDGKQRTPRRLYSHLR
jgi:hypothetical protein